MKNIIKPLTKSILIPLGLTAAAATDGAIQKNRSGPGTTTLIISNEEMNDLIKVVKSLQESGLLIKEVSEKIKNDAKEQKGGCLILLIGTVGASLLGYCLTGKTKIRAEEGTIRAGHDL